MSEWWTYRLYDFLLFTPRTYYRLFELYNAAIWPAQIPAAAAGLWLVWLCAKAPLRPVPSPADGEAGRRPPAAPLLVLAGAWVWVAVAFLWRRYATINWAAKYAAWAFLLEAALLAWAGWRGRFEPPPGLVRRIGVGLAVFAVLLEPLSGPLLGRPLRQIELFGLAPDPTAVATLGVLLALRPRDRWLLMIVPVLWCALTGLTLLAMSAGDWWIAPAAAVAAIAAAAGSRLSGSARAGARRIPP
jgi:hypothetical protein